MKLNDLKRRHNAVMIEGQEAYAKALELYTVANELQRVIQKYEGDDYDPVPLIFGDGFYIHEDDEDKEVGE